MKRGVYHRVRECGAFPSPPAPIAEGGVTAAQRAAGRLVRDKRGVITPVIDAGDVRPNPSPKRKRGVVASVGGAADAQTALGAGVFRSVGSASAFRPVACAPASGHCAVGMALMTW